MNRQTDIKCKDAITSMLKNSQTKVIFPIITYGLLLEYLESGKYEFKDSEIRKLYHRAVFLIQSYVGHKLHTGGKYYDAYPIRNMPRYGALIVIEKNFQLPVVFRDNASVLIDWIPSEIKKLIDSKIGIIPKLGNETDRLSVASDINYFNNFIAENITRNASNFEVFSFAAIKVHLEKFACKIYRDTRTSSHDKGVDLSTNFGVVYQIKKLRLLNKTHAEEILSEIKLNFDSERMNDGNIVLVIDDISKEIKNYLINMKIQSISKDDIVHICRQFSEVEDRMKVLKVIYDEFRREYESQI
ncbi:MAG: HaeII family restriction endonuclease [Prevotellaceae bacterium]|nr:HaeII family restriction endonuclease [Prevotellaceae bacterium]